MSDAELTFEAPGKDGKLVTFSFGPEMSMLDGEVSIKDLFECLDTNGLYFETPISTAMLSKSFRANPHHESAIRLKCNQITKLFKPTELMSVHQFKAFALDYLVFGYAAIEKIPVKTGRALRYERLLARYVRRSIDLKDFYYLQGQTVGVQVCGDSYAYMPYKFPREHVYMLQGLDIDQELYGVPEYISALESVWLNRAATLFRRRYYINGNHAGYLLYMNDPQLQKTDVEELKKTIQGTKGLGNFKNIFLYSEGGDPKGVQLIPLGEATAKDEFFSMKNVSRDDVLAAHRVPPQLLGIVPSNNGGFGDVGKANEIFIKNEIFPMMDTFLAINNDLRQPVIDFIGEKEALEALRTQ